MDFSSLCLISAKSAAAEICGKSMSAMVEALGGGGGGADMVG